MKTKKRKKNTRYRGSHTAHRGAKKKGRGKGHRGGVGNSGSGKRADQKKTKFNIKEHFGKDRALRKKQKVKLKSINLGQISEKFAGKKEANLKGYKILSSGELNSQIKITASAASKQSIDKVKKSGGDITLVKNGI